jgi:hypothetical protein
LPKPLQSLSAKPEQQQELLAKQLHKQIGQQTNPKTIGHNAPFKTTNY